MGRTRSSNRALFALLLLAVSAAAQSQESGGEAPSEWTLVAVEGRGDPNSLAWDRTHGRVALGHGTRIELWSDAARGLRAEQPIAAFDVDRTLLALEWAGEELWIAASTGGLVRVGGALAEGRPEVRTVLREARPCVALDVEDEVLWALFAGLDDNRAVAFDVATSEPLTSIELPRGIAQDLLQDGGALWVSCGAAGLARVRDALGAEPQVEWLIESVADFPGFEAPGFPRNLGELARGAGHLFVAGDDLGVVRLRLDDAGEVLGAPTAQPLRLDGRPTYVSSLSADPELGLLVAGSNRAPRAAALGAPYGVLGWLDHRFALAGIDPHSFEHGSGEGLSLLLERGDALELNAQASQDAADWRGLNLAGTVLFEQHAGRGARRTRIAPGELHRPRGVRPSGFAPVDVQVSLAQPGRLRLGLDPAGSVAPGALRFTEAGALEVERPLSEPADFGLFVGDPWLDGDGDEWFVAGGGLELKLWRRRERSALQAWPLTLPPDARGRRGHTYFGASKLGDLLALTRAQCDEGLLLVDAAALMERAAATPSGTPLPLPIRAALGTRVGREPYAGAGDPFDFVWSPSLLVDGSERLRCLLPAGLGHVDRGEPARCLLYDLTGWAAGDVPEPTVVEAPSGPGHAIDAELVLQSDRLFGFVGDLLGGIHVFELTDGSAPVWRRTHAAPISPYDGQRPNLFDLERRADRDELWVAYGRAGVFGYDVSEPETDFELIQVIDTPGLALKLEAATVHGADALFVTDQKGGLRVYR